MVCRGNAQTDHDNHVVAKKMGAGGGGKNGATQLNIWIEVLD